MHESASVMPKESWLFAEQTLCLHESASVMPKESESASCAIEDAFAGWPSKFAPSLALRQTLEA